MESFNTSGYSNPALRQVIKDRDTVLRRSIALQKAVQEYDESVKELVKQAEVKSKSVRLSKTDMAELLGLSRAHMYKMPGVDIKKCTTYEDLYKQVQKHRPSLLKELEENFERFLAHQNKTTKNGHYAG